MLPYGITLPRLNPAAPRRMDEALATAEMLIRRHPSETINPWHGQPAMAADKHHGMPKGETP